MLLKRFQQSASFAVIGALLAACGATPSSNTDPNALPTAAVIATPDNPPLATTNPAPTAAPAPTEVPAAPTIAPTAEPTVAPTVAPTEPPIPEGPVAFPNVGSDLHFGVVTHLYWTDRERVLALVNNAGFDWVRQQVVWRDIHDPVKGIYGWEELDKIVAAVHNSGRKLLVNVVQSPTAFNATNGLPDDTKVLADFYEQMILRYGDKIAAFEIWNEPNLAHENGGNIVPEDVGHYVEILIESYKRIKALNPNAIVLAAASSSSGVTNPDIALSDEAFYRAMYEYKGGIVHDYFDVQAVHPGAAANPPDTLWPENPSYIEGCQPSPTQCWNDHPTHYFRHVENVRKWMVEYGMGDKPIWLTEFGWTTPNNTPTYEYGNLVPLEKQAEYISGAVRRTYEQYPWLTNMFIWNMNFAVLWGIEGNPNHEQAAYSILNPDWSPRPSYLAMQSLIAEIKQKQGR